MVSTNPKIVIPHSLKQRVLIPIHYPVTTGRSKHRKLYFRIKRHFYWLSLVMDGSIKVRDSTECFKPII